MKFSEKLIILRKNKNLSQEDLGNELGVARQTISKWELGETTPEMDKLVRMSEIFDISLDELIKDTDKKMILKKININDTNTQQLAGLTIKILKGIGIIILVIIIISIIMIILGRIAYNKIDSKTEMNSVIVTQKQLTLNDVKELANKGEQLSWIDFEDYECEDIGSGLKVLYYEIDGMYHLLIGGPSENELPNYIRLVVDNDNEKFIDIRTGNIDEFIKETDTSETVNAK